MKEVVELQFWPGLELVELVSGLARELEELGRSRLSWNLVWCESWWGWIFGWVDPAHSAHASHVQVVAMSVTAGVADETVVTSRTGQQTAWTGQQTARTGQQTTQTAQLTTRPTTAHKSNPAGPMQLTA